MYLRMANGGCLNLSPRPLTGYDWMTLWTLIQADSIVVSPDVQLVEVKI